jgi:hypothetical protein
VQLRSMPRCSALPATVQCGTDAWPACRCCCPAPLLSPLSLAVFPAAALTALTTTTFAHLLQEPFLRYWWAAQAAAFIMRPSGPTLQLLQLMRNSSAALQARYLGAVTSVAAGASGEGAWVAGSQAASHKDAS